MKQSNPGESTRITVAGGNLAGWRQALGELALACAGSFPAEEAQRLRDMRRLLAAAPSPALLRGLAVPCAERVEELIRANAAASAALRPSSSRRGLHATRDNAQSRRRDCRP